MSTSPRAELDPARLRAGHGAKWTAVEPDVLPAWVADMDIGIPEPVRARLIETIERQDLGYPYWPDGDPVINAFLDHMRSRYDWRPSEGRTRVFSDLIQILQVVIEHTTDPGDGIALHVPNYPPFLAAIHRAGRRIVPLTVDRTRHDWVLDLDRHRQIIAAERCRLLVLVNPHNPTGRVFLEAELRGLAEIAVDHQIPVLADEIHADLTYRPHRHVPFAGLDRAVEDLTVTATSATKAFNLAGVRCAVAHFGHRSTADAVARAPLDYFGTPSTLSRIATVAAWRESQDWLDVTTGLLARNRDRVTAWARTHPEISYLPPEATYLAWLDFAQAGLGPDPAAALLRDVRVHLSPGAEFTKYTRLNSSTYARINFATTSSNLNQILGRLDGALRPPRPDLGSAGSPEMR